MSAVASLQYALTRVVGRESFATGLAGFAAQQAANELTLNWRTALGSGATENLVADVDRVIDELLAFRERAQGVLPVANGGLGGQSAEHWLERLADIDISVYEAEDLPGHFGYTGCDADCYLSETEAVVAAVQANATLFGVA